MRTDVQRLVGRGVVDFRQADGKEMWKEELGVWG